MTQIIVAKEVSSGDTEAHRVYPNPYLFVLQGPLDGATVQLCGNFGPAKEVIVAEMSDTGNEPVLLPDCTVFARVVNAGAGTSVSVSLIQGDQNPFNLEAFSGGSTTVVGTDPQTAINTADISERNMIVGTGAPDDSLGDDGMFYRDLSALPGEFGIWGPKAGGTWPATPSYGLVPFPSNSEIFSQLSAWTLNTGTALVSSNFNGVPTVIIADSRTGNNANYLLGGNVPTVADQTVRIRFVRQEVGANQMLLRRSGPAGFASDLIIDLHSGGTISRNVGGDGNPYAEEVTVTDETIEVIATFPANIDATGWALFPAAANGTTASNVTFNSSLVGSLELIEFDLNYSRTSDTLSMAPIFDGVLVDAFPKWVGSVSAPISTAGINIPLNVDLNEVDQMIFHIIRSNGAWPHIVAVDVSDIVLDSTSGYILHWHDNAFVGLSLDSSNVSSGLINVRSVSSEFDITEIEFKKRAVGVSSRVGEWVFKSSTMFANSDDAISRGYLPVTPGTIVDGAIDNPIWAAGYPDFVSGDDIVFPANVEGIFLRNLGGNADAEGDFQSDTQARSPNNPVNTAVSNGGGATVRSVAVSAETRPDNRAYQLYTIIDNYLEPSNAVSGDTPYAVQTGNNFTAVDLGLYRDLTFEVASVGDGNQPVTFPIAFSEAPKTWDVQISLHSSGNDGRSGSFTTSSLTATEIIINRDDTFADVDNPFFVVRVRGLI